MRKSPLGHKIGSLTSTFARIASPSDTKLQVSGVGLISLSGTRANHTTVQADTPSIACGVLSTRREGLTAAGQPGLCEPRLVDHRASPPSALTRRVRRLRQNAHDRLRPRRRGNLPGPPTPAQLGWPIRRWISLHHYKRLHCSRDIAQVRAVRGRRVAPSGPLRAQPPWHVHVAVTNLFVDEALRSEDHPGVTFRSGPTGRRAGLVGGPDVWEVIDTLLTLREQESGLTDDALVTATAEAIGLSERKVGIAVGYYAEYRDEIDERIEGNRQATREAETAWKAQQALLRGDFRAS